MHFVPSLTVEIGFLSACPICQPFLWSFSDSFAVRKNKPASWAMFGHGSSEQSAWHGPRGRHAGIGMERQVGAVIDDTASAHHCFGSFRSDPRLGDLPVYNMKAERVEADFRAQFGGPFDLRFFGKAEMVDPETVVETGGALQQSFQGIPAQVRTCATSPIRIPFPTEIG
jgi:hypothetical protein